MIDMHCSQFPSHKVGKAVAPGLLAPLPLRSTALPPGPRRGTLVALNSFCAFDRTSFHPPVLPTCPLPNIPSEQQSARRNRTLDDKRERNIVWAKMTILYAPMDISAGSQQCLHLALQYQIGPEYRNKDGKFHIQNLPNLTTKPNKLRIISSSFVAPSLGA